eukprot:TRINITY_DN1387_c0_g3_i1.p2 TRINITY_DN1387_c0_g3~~TRINITY_DN1387_c0_g3_i1.p2  ORF type:complete len:296 (-),score=49.46 TRINITY_DN1387_c0_g3_i1:226-1113(-)
MPKKERKQKRVKNKRNNKNQQQQESSQQQDLEAAQPVETLQNDNILPIIEQKKVVNENENEDKTYYYGDPPMNGNTQEINKLDIVEKEKQVRFSQDENNKEQEEEEEIVKEQEEKKEEQVLENRFIERKRAFKGYDDDFDPKELREEEAEKIRNSSAYVLLQKVFSFFFPGAIKRFVSTSIQCIGGILISSIIIGSFIWLFLYFGECDQQLIETSEVPDNMIYCQERLLAQQSIREIDVNGVWSNEVGYDERRGGPWQVNFKAYKATEDIFEDTTDQLLNRSAEFVANMEKKPFY